MDRDKNRSRSSSLKGILQEYQLRGNATSIFRNTTIFATFPSTKCLHVYSTSEKYYGTYLTFILAGISTNIRTRSATTEALARSTQLLKYFSRWCRTHNQRLNTFQQLSIDHSLIKCYSLSSPAGSFFLLLVLTRRRNVQVAEHINLASVLILESSLPINLVVFCCLFVYAKTSFMTLQAFIHQETSINENVVMSRKNVARQPKKGPKQHDVVFPRT